jgi:hypothetical protein
VPEAQPQERDPAFVGSEGPSTPGGDDAREGGW